MIMGTRTHAERSQPLAVTVAGSHEPRPSLTTTTEDPARCWNVGLPVGLQHTAFLGYSMLSVGVYSRKVGHLPKGVLMV